MNERGGRGRLVAWSTVLQPERPQRQPRVRSYLAISSARVT